MDPTADVFSAPQEIRQILARPYRSWSDEDRARVFAWLQAPPRRNYLKRVVRLAAESGSVSEVNSDLAVDEFYEKRVSRLVRRASVSNIGAILLVDFERYVLSHLDRKRRWLVGDAAAYESSGVQYSIRPPQFEASSAGPSTMAGRGSKLDRVLEEWTAGAESHGEINGGQDGEWVETTVFGPRKVAQGRHFMLQAFAHRPDSSDEATALAREFDHKSTSRLGFRTLSARLRVGSELTYSLSIAGVPIVEPSQRLTWSGKTEGVAFGVEVPIWYERETMTGHVLVTADSVPIGQITVKIEIKRQGKVKSAKMDALDAVATAAKRYSKAFISYASADRNKVLARVQMLRIHGIDYFQDLLKLEPGDRWGTELFKHIEACDLFLLFWSSHAKASEWVMKEVAYAIKIKNGDDDAAPDILPVIIEGPPMVAPPPELKHLHFNDSILYFMTGTA